MVDVVCLGRAAIDFYGEQFGASLTQTHNFTKYVGGSAANTAIAISRLGHQVALISRVGNESNGWFVRQQLEHEGVDISSISLDPDRLTGLVILGLQSSQYFPHLFYRENCADMALRVEDIRPELFNNTRILILSGTHLSQPGTRKVSEHALKLAKDAGAKIFIDLDYRPVLWGFAKPGGGHTREAFGPEVSAAMRPFIDQCDVIVGTEEEFCAAANAPNAQAAVQVFAKTRNPICVVKAGPKGCHVFEKQATWVEPTCAVTVLKTLGAGDAFMGGFVSGVLDGETWIEAARHGNDCGAIVVTRHSCSEAMPFRAELDIWRKSSGKDQTLLEQTHRRLSRRPMPKDLCIFALDNRLLFEKWTQETQQPPEQLHKLKKLLVQSALQVAKTHSQITIGVLVDDKWGSEALSLLQDESVWVARPIEESGVLPLQFWCGPEVGLELRTWPTQHVVKCLVRDSQAHKDIQRERMQQLAHACHATQHELLLELLPTEETSNWNMLQAIEQLLTYDLDPHFWKLPPPETADAWQKLEQLLPQHAQVLLLGGGLAEAILKEHFARAAQTKLAKGFAIGRTIFADASQQWLQRKLSDEQLVSAVAKQFDAFCMHWIRAKGLA